MADWEFLNKHRIAFGPWCSDPLDGFNGYFKFPVPGEPRAVCVICSDGMGWQHVSVSFGENHSIPPWRVMCQVKELFWDPEDWVVQFHPPRSQYVNNHPGCLHLFRCTDGREQPTPPAFLVGML